MSFTEKIHILGLGNLGCFFAHCLKQADKTTPISLIFHRQSLFSEWDNGFQQICVTADREMVCNRKYQNSRDAFSRSSSSDPLITSSSGYTIEAIPSVNPPDADLIRSFDRHSDNSSIQNLILATKTCKTLEALSSVKHRLSKQSTILLVQNGLGIIPKINNELFPDSSTRPGYLAALITHGLFHTGPFRTVHAGLGNVMFSHVSEPSPTTRSLVERILAASKLNPFYFDREDFYKKQLEKLVINAIINPLTALFRCKNGQLFWAGIRRMPLLKLMRRLVLEINQVFTQINHSRNSVDSDRFSVGNMELLVTGTARKTRNNMSSMLQDVIMNKETEIDAINGWIVVEGEKAGLDVQCNKKLVKLVKNREKLYEHQIETHFPGTISPEEWKTWTYKMEEMRHNGRKSSKKFFYNSHGICVQAW